MIYVLFVIALTLAGLAGYEFFYLSYLDAQNRQLKRRIAELERDAMQHRTALQFSQRRVEELTALHEETWPELVDDERLR
jgi:16S rRNA C1402 (ribose-2'-O) methylase RsmI